MLDQTTAESRAFWFGLASAALKSSAFRLDLAQVAGLAWALESSAFWFDLAQAALDLAKSSQNALELAQSQAQCTRLEGRLGWHAKMHLT